LQRIERRFAPRRGAEAAVWAILGGKVARDGYDNPLSISIGSKK